MNIEIKNKFRITKESIKEKLLWLIGGMFLLVITEFLLRGELRYVKLLMQNKLGVFITNYLVILLLTSPMFLLKRKKAYYFMMSFIILAISCVSKYLTELRGVPLTFSDLYSIGEAIEISSNYITSETIVYIIIGIILVLTIFIFLLKKEKNNKRISSYFNIVFMLIVVISLPLLIKDQINKGQMGYMRWDITASYKKNGYIYSTIESGLRYIRIKPKGYSKKSIENIRDLVDKNEKEDKRVLNKNKPNMIFIQLESFMDPTVVKNANFSEDPIPNYRKICEENKGYIASVPTTGGGTVRTEYEVMTGNNIDYLTPGEIPYNTILKGKHYNSLATTLKDKGYASHAIHNFQGNFYTRNNAYDKLGFDTFTSLEYMNNYEKNERGWVKDTILTEYIQKALDSTENSDLVYTIAVQGHSAYPTDSLKLYDFPIKVSGDLDDKDKNQLYYYANQLKETDDFIGDIMNMVDEMDEETLVVFYSDHMPGLNIFSNEDYELDPYEAPFTFYSNFEIRKFDFDKTESYNIGTLAMLQAGIEYGPLEKFHAYLGSDKNYEKYEQLLQYDILFGKNYYLKEDEKCLENNMKMGIDEVVVNSVEDEKGSTIVKGKNFTRDSSVYINDKKIDTVFIDEVTLKIKKNSFGETLVVKQLGRNDGFLSSSNEFSLNGTILAKK